MLSFLQRYVKSVHVTTTCKQNTNFQESEKFSTTYTIVLFFFRPSVEAFKPPIRFSNNFAQSFFTQRGPGMRKGIKIV